MNRFIYPFPTFTLVVVLASFIAFVPGSVGAAFTQGDIECGTKYCFPGKCVPSPKDPKCVPCPTFTCTDVTNNKTTKGKCISSAPGVCRGTSAEGLTGKQENLGGQIPKEVMDVLKGLLDKLMQQKQGGGEQQQGQQQPQQPLTQQPCLTYYDSQTPSSDPCARYNPGASGLITPTSGVGGGTAVSDLLKALGENTQSSEKVSGTDVEGEGETEEPGEEQGTSEQILADLEKEISEDTDVKDDATDTEDSQTTPSAKTDVVKKDGLGTITNLFGRLVGRFEESPTGATAIGEGRDEEAGVEVSGFYGQTGSFQSQGGMITRLCSSRPWASSLTSYIVPNSFFDNLCESRGYRTAPVIQPVSIQKTPLVPRTDVKQEKQVQKTEPAVSAEARVWAVPARVAVGSRTSIFWNSKGAESCIVTSPDGSFREEGFSGGASTVPLSGATIFTISCTVKDGQPVTNYVTVEIGI